MINEQEPKSFQSPMATVCHEEVLLPLRAASEGRAGKFMMAPVMLGCLEERESDASSKGHGTGGLDLDLSLLDVLAGDPQPTFTPVDITDISDDVPITDPIEYAAETESRIAETEGGAGQWGASPLRGCDEDHGDTGPDTDLSLNGGGISSLPVGTVPYQLVVLGRGDGSGREPTMVRLDGRLLDRLASLASGSRSALIELALHHVVQELQSAQERGEPPLMMEARDVQRRLDAFLDEPRAGARAP